MTNMNIAWTVCELQYNYISDANHDVWRTNFCLMRAFIVTLGNPWRIIRADGVVIASSYEGFTSLAQAVANGRVE